MLQGQPDGKLRDKHVGHVAAEHADRLLPRMTEGSLIEVLRDERMVAALREGCDAPRLAFHGLPMRPEPVGRVLSASASTPRPRTKKGLRSKVTDPAGSLIAGHACGCIPAWKAGTVSRDGNSSSMLSPRSRVKVFRW